MRFSYQQLTVNNSEMEEIRKKIEKLLIEKRISKRDFIEKIGMSNAGYYHMYENNSMKVSVLLKIAEVLETPVINLLINSQISDFTTDFNKEESLKDGIVKSLYKQNEAMTSQISDLIKMQLINAETI